MIYIHPPTFLLTLPQSLTSITFITTQEGTGGGGGGGGAAQGPRIKRSHTWQGGGVATKDGSSGDK